MSNHIHENSPTDQDYPMELQHQVKVYEQSKLLPNSEFSFGRTNFTETSNSLQNQAQNNTNHQNVQQNETDSISFIIDSISFMQNLDHENSEKSELFDLSLGEIECSDLSESPDQIPSNLPTKHLIVLPTIMAHSRVRIKAKQAATLKAFIPCQPVFQKIEKTGKELEISFESIYSQGQAISQNSYDENMAEFDSFDSTEFNVVCLQRKLEDRQIQYLMIDAACRVNVHVVLRPRQRRHHSMPSCPVPSFNLLI